jgi:uncharacterized membrane protein YgcG
MSFMNRFIKFLFILLLVEWTRNVTATRRRPVEYHKASHIRRNLQNRDFPEARVRISDENFNSLSNIQPHRTSLRRMRRKGPAKIRNQDRRLGIGGQGGTDVNGGSSGISGSSSGSGGNGASSSGSGGSSGGLGWGWDDNGSYCGCLCYGGWTSSNSGISCEYAVYANNTVDTGRYVITQAEVLFS